MCFTCQNELETCQELNPMANVCLFACSWNYSFWGGERAKIELNIHILNVLFMLYINFCSISWSVWIILEGTIHLCMLAHVCCMFCQKAELEDLVNSRNQARSVLLAAIDDFLLVVGSLPISDRLNTLKVCGCK